MCENYSGTAIKRKCIQSIFIGSIFILIFLPATGNNHRLLAQSEETEEIDDSIGKVINNYGTVLGLVKENGLITNRFGAPLGSVDEKGSIFNVSKMVIGKINPSTRGILNQSGTVLGFVDQEGSVFNNNGDRLGGVQMNPVDIIMVGGAARLIFFKKR